eukprot:5950266-Pyramimonas_sp.AAC.1
MLLAGCTSSGPCPSALPRGPANDHPGGDGLVPAAPAPRPPPRGCGQGPATAGRSQSLSSRGAPGQPRGPRLPRTPGGQRGRA